MKRCESCEAEWPDTALLCRDCDDVLEDVVYRRTLLRCLAGGAVMHLLVGAYGDASFTSGVVHHAAAFFCVLYPLKKLRDKVHDPARRVLYEMGSVWADRVSRAMITGLGGYIMYAVLTPSILLDDGAPPWLAAYFQVTEWTILIVGLSGICAMLVDQGLAFFDLRIANTYARRGRYDASDRPG